MSHRRLAPRSLSAAAVAVLALAPLIQRDAAGAILYANDFATGADGFTTTQATVTTDGPGGSAALSLVDASTAANFSSSLSFGSPSFPAFTTAEPGTSTLRVSFDWAVTSFSGTANSIATPRMQLNGSGFQFSIGFGRDDANRLLLYAGAGNAPTPSTAGLLYDLGPYDAGAANTNDTDGYVRLQVDYRDQSTSAVVTALRNNAVLGQVVVSGLASASFSRANGSLAFITGTSTTATPFLDNVTVAVVPEPSAVFLLLGAAGTLAVWRRWRRS